MLLKFLQQKSLELKWRSIRDRTFLQWQRTSLQRCSNYLCRIAFHFYVLNLSTFCKSNSCAYCHTFCYVNKDVTDKPSKWCTYLPVSSLITPPTAIMLLLSILHASTLISQLFARGVVHPLWLNFLWDVQQQATSTLQILLQLDS